MSFVTEKQLGLLHHTLGVTPERRIPFRNHFVAGDGHHDQPDLKGLEAMGFMSRRANAEWMGGGDLFRVTEAGESYALDNLPQPQKYSRYEEYRRSECDEGFAWFLGFDAPKFETYANHCSPFSFGQRTSANWVRMRSSRAIGEFRATKKDAKTSYKAAMKAARQRNEWRTA